MFQQTTATQKILNLRKRIRGVAGGTSASKTISILLWLIDRAETPQAGVELISVVSESYPHLKRGAMRDFLNIMETMGHYKDSAWNRTDSIYTFDTGSRIEFFSADQPGKVRGPRRDILFINEANNVPYETYDQLAIRTKKIIWLDWNPTHAFWWYEEVAPHTDNDFLTLTYLDNEALDEAIVQDIESHRHNRNWWLVYGLGQLGEVESRVYTGWIVIDQIPHEAKLVRRGLDFGFSNDPAAIVDIYKYNGGFILDERLYRKGMSNKDLADFLNNCEDPSTIVVADSSEPKSIDELSMYGVPVQGAQKGQGSISQGIQYVQDQRVSMTQRSTNLIKEYRNYLFEVDRDGKQTRDPQDFQNHLMDALRYGLETYYYHQDRQAGIVGTISSSGRAKESFMTNPDGTVEAKALHIDIGRAVRQSTQEDKDWQHI